MQPHGIQGPNARNLSRGRRSAGELSSASNGKSCWWRDICIHVDTIQNSICSGRIWVPMGHADTATVFISCYSNTPFLNLYDRQNIQRLHNDLYRTTQFCQYDGGRTRRSTSRDLPARKAECTLPSRNRRSGEDPGRNREK